MPHTSRAELLARALDALDTGVMVMSADLDEVLHTNDVASELLGAGEMAVLREAISNFILARNDTRRMPSAMRVVLGARPCFLRVVSDPGTPPLEIVLLREEVLRDADLFRVLNARHGVSRREYQILCGLRLGKTNRQIATDLELVEGTVARHVHRLLRRFDVSNRTRLANLIEQIAGRRT